MCNKYHLKWSAVLFRMCDYLNNVHAIMTFCYDFIFVLGAGSNLVCPLSTGPVESVFTFLRCQGSNTQLPLVLCVCFPVFKWRQQNPKEGLPDFPTLLPGTRAHWHGQESGHGWCLSETWWVMRHSSDLGFKMYSSKKDWSLALAVFKSSLKLYSKEVLTFPMTGQTILSSEKPCRGCWSPLLYL